MVKTGEAGKACHLINFSPEASFELFLDFLEGFVVPQKVQVSEYTHDFWKAMHLADIQELKDLHFKAKTGINQEQYLKRSQVTV